MVSEVGDVAADAPCVETSCFEGLDIERNCVARATDGVSDRLMVYLLVIRGWSTPPWYH